MKPESNLLYLELLKKTLSFALWREPPVPVGSGTRKRSALGKFLVSIGIRLLALNKMQLVRTVDYSESQRRDGQIWPVYAVTMIGQKRLDHLQQCVEAVLSENVEGHFIETGAWRGGSCILMRATLAAYGIEDRTVFVADSFEGLPKPDEEKHPMDKGDIHHKYDYLAVSQNEVEENFRKYGLLDKQVVFLKGWFKDTLPKAPIDRLAILRLDGDMYGSTMDALECLYPKLSEGGFCIVDDYALPNCKTAVNDYRAKHGIDSEIKQIDWTGHFWRKTKTIK